MNGPGRPSRTNVERRRRKVSVFLVASALRSEDAIKLVAEKLRVTERTVRADLEALREEFEAKSITVLPKDLLEAIEVADTLRLIEALGKRVMAEMVRGAIDRELGATLIDALREQRHVIRAVREEQGHTAFKALEILTPQEQELLRKERERSAPEPLAPGEFPAPPEGSPPPPVQEKSGDEREGGEP